MIPWGNWQWKYRFRKEGIKRLVNECLIKFRKVHLSKCLIFMSFGKGNFFFHVLKIIIIKQVILQNKQMFVEKTENRLTSNRNSVCKIIGKSEINFEKNSINLLLPLPAKALNVTVRTKETKIPKIPRRFSTLWVFTGANIFSALIQVFNWNVIWKKVPDYGIWLIWIIYQQEEIIKQVLRSQSQLTKKSYVTQRNTRSLQGKTTYHSMSKAANESIPTCVTSQHNKGPWVKPQKECACLRKSL